MLSLRPLPAVIVLPHPSHKSLLGSAPTPNPNIWPKHQPGNLLKHHRKGGVKKLHMSCCR
jgi:hypothetical protein